VPSLIDDDEDYADGEDEYEDELEDAGRIRDEEDDDA
jgi:hypothetical protein